MKKAKIIALAVPVVISVAVCSIIKKVRKNKNVKFVEDITLYYAPPTIEQLDEVDTTLFNATVLNTTAWCPRWGKTIMWCILMMQDETTTSTDEWLIEDNVQVMFETFERIVVTSKYEKLVIKQNDDMFEVTLFKKN